MSLRHSLKGFNFKHINALSHATKRHIIRLSATSKAISSSFRFLKIVKPNSNIKPGPLLCDDISILLYSIIRRIAPTIVGSKKGKQVALFPFSNPRPPKTIGPAQIAPINTPSSVFSLTNSFKWACAFKWLLPGIPPGKIKASTQLKSASSNR